jgi:biopolymer transport protein ExbB
LYRRSLLVAVVVVVGSCAGWSALAQAPGGPAPGTPAPGAAAAPAASPTSSPQAAEPGDSSKAPEKAKSSGFWSVFWAGGLVGDVIMLLSLAAVALVVEFIMTIRQKVLMPPGMADEVRELLSQGKLSVALQRCRQQPSFLGFVLEAGITEADTGWSAVEKAVEDAMADQSARVLRKIEYLSVIGNIAPMLGLLGTVIGMIMAFKQVAETQGAARAADLAEGIYLALVTTVQGLIVAIPALGALAIFRSRVDQLVAEVAYVSEHVFAPLKRRVGRGKSSPTAAAPPAPPIPPRGVN